MGSFGPQKRGPQDDRAREWVAELRLNFDCRPRKRFPVWPHGAFLVLTSLILTSIDMPAIHARPSPFRRCPHQTRARLAGQECGQARFPQGLKPAWFMALTARLKPCPSTKPLRHERSEQGDSDSVGKIESGPGGPAFSTEGFSFPFRNRGCPVPSTTLRAGSCVSSWKFPVDGRGGNGWHGVLRPARARASG